MIENRPAAGDSARDFLVGQLIIAAPNMGDRRFEKSVIFMCSHDEDHAMGVVVNKALDEVSLVDLLEQLEIAPSEAAANIPVFYGGPVQTKRGAVLHSLDYQLSSTVELPCGLGLTAAKEILIDIAGARPVRPPPKRYLLAVGHAGWTAGQLEQEIAMNAWAHCDADEDLIFGGVNSPTWQIAFERLGVTGAMFSPEWSRARGGDQPLN